MASRHSSAGLNKLAYLLPVIHAWREEVAKEKEEEEG